MQLPKNVVRKLFHAFKKFDMDGSGSIGLVELLTQLDLPRTKFTEKVFSIFDDDGSGEIEFKEFVLSVWNYCTLTKGNLGTVSILIPLKLSIIMHSCLTARITHLIFTYIFLPLTLSRTDMFAFDLYDSDSSGELSAGEVLQLISDIFGKHEMKNSKHAKA